jgi:uncharacterized protein YdeI (YjbR/CyaY-like superfamily)
MDHKGLPVIEFASHPEWERWLARHHNSDSGIWIAIAKKGSAIASVRYPEVLEVAICFGWIDGRRERLDDERFLQMFTPRRPRSRWSRINREKAEELTAQGRMAQAGLAQIEDAKRDGRWEDAYEGQRNATVPQDLQRQLDARPAAAKFFATLSSQNRYSIIYRVNDAKRPQTRERRIEKFIQMLEAGEQIHP